MERNALIATVLVILILVAWMWYQGQFERPPEQPAPGPPGPPAAAPPAATPPTKRAKAPQKLPFAPTEKIGPPEKEVVVETPLLRVVLTTRGAQVRSWELKRYVQANGRPVDLAAGTSPTAFPAPLGGWAEADAPAAPIFAVDRDRLLLAGKGDEGAVTFSYISPAGIRLEKALRFRGDSYRVEGTLRAKNLGLDEAAATPRLSWGPGIREAKRPDAKDDPVGPPTTWMDGKRVQDDVAKLAAPATHAGSVSWTALETKYFAVALLPRGRGASAQVMRGEGGQAAVALAAPPVRLAPGGEAALEAVVYAGPKDLDHLRAAGQDLQELVDLGWFSVIARPALDLLKFLNRFIGNYGVAIVLITILLKVALHPLTYKSLKSMQAMQALQPRLQAINERYKNNPEKKREETMALYRKHGINPMGGCLPMLLQMPILIALYNALSSAVELWRAPFALWITDLSTPDELFTVSLAGADRGIHALAILMGASQYVQQKMTPAAGDPVQAKMMLYMMPLFLTFVFWGFPSGLVLYWLVNNILQIGQQYLINQTLRRHPAATAA